MTKCNKNHKFIIVDKWIDLIDIRDGHTVRSIVCKDCVDELCAIIVKYKKHLKKRKKEDEE